MAWIRFKAQFVKYVRAEVAETVADRTDIEPELRHLVGAWLSCGQEIPQVKP